MRTFFVLFSFLASFLFKEASASALPHQESSEHVVGLTLGADVGVSPEGKHLGFHFGPYFEISQHLTLELGLGFESELGQEYDFRNLAFSIELSHPLSEKLAIVGAWHGVIAGQHTEAGIFFGIELPFHQSLVDTVNLSFLVGKLTDGQGAVMAAVHWSFVPEMFTRR